MSKKACFLTFVIATTLIMACFVLNFSPVTSHVSAVFSAMQGIYLSVIAIITALLLHKQKFYWLIILGCAILASVIIQYFVMGGAIFTVAVLYKIVAFTVYAFWVLLMRYMI